MQDPRGKAGNADCMKRHIIEKMNEQKVDILYERVIRNKVKGNGDEVLNESLKRESQQKQLCNKFQ